MKKAVALISGGLDSLLAAKVIQDQGIYVEGICFNIGFGGIPPIRKKKQLKPPRDDAKWVADQLGIKLHKIDVFEDFRDEAMINPKHGYGSNINPCLDCKIFIVKHALAWIEKHGFDFIVTGEVVGQRGKSQRPDTLPVTARDSGAKGILVRPLCAKHLPETIPEKEGWIDRENLLDFHGRNRKPQMALAAKYGFKDYATPGGGCLVTEPGFSSRMKDLMAHRKGEIYSRDDVALLKAGRHLRIDDDMKIIIGREDGENEYLKKFSKDLIKLHCSSCAGPLTIIDGKLTEKSKNLAAAITARFSQGKNLDSVEVTVIYPDNNKEKITVKPLTEDEMKPDWYL